MIYVFCGKNREKALGKIREILGSEYEVFEGSGLEAQDLMNIFQGTSLFATTRKILLKDLTPAPKRQGEGEAPETLDFYEIMAEYVNTPHTVVIWETYTPRKKSYQKFKKLPQVKFDSFDETNKVRPQGVFNILDVAYRDGPRAIKMLEEVKVESDPYMFFGLMASQGIKKFRDRAGEKEKRVLRELSRLDMQMKSTTIEPWTLISSFLLQVSSL